MRVRIWMAFRSASVSLGFETVTLMSHDSESRSISGRFVQSALIVLLLAGNGCGNKEAPTTAPPPAVKPALVSAEKTSFNEVAAQLDPGGSIYGYLSTRQWLEGLSDRVNSW